MKIAHIAVEVPKLEGVAEAVQQIFGVTLTAPKEIASQKVRAQFVELGGVQFEFLEPTSLDSPISSFLEKRGKGIHHVAFEVDDLEKTLKTLKEKNIPLIHGTSQKGAEGKKIAFLHPNAVPGLLIELVERTSE